MSLYMRLYYYWSVRQEHNADKSSAAFAAYINNLSNNELLREISDALEAGGPV